MNGSGDARRGGVRHRDARRATRLAALAVGLFSCLTLVAGGFAVSAVRAAVGTRAAVVVVAGFVFGWLGGSVVLVSRYRRTAVDADGDEIVVTGPWRVTRCAPGDVVALSAGGGYSGSPSLRLHLADGRRVVADALAWEDRGVLFPYLPSHVAEEAGWDRVVKDKARTPWTVLVRPSDGGFVTAVVRKPWQPPAHTEDYPSYGAAVARAEQLAAAVAAADRYDPSR